MNCRSFHHRFSNQLELISADQGDSELTSGIYLTGLLAEATAVRPGEWTRVVVTILQANEEKMMLRAGRCGMSQSLWAIL